MISYLVLFDEEEQVVRIIRLLNRFLFMEFSENGLLVYSGYDGPMVLVLG